MSPLTSATDTGREITTWDIEFRASPRQPWAVLHFGATSEHAARWRLHRERVAWGHECEFRLVEVVSTRRVVE